MLFYINKYGSVASSTPVTKEDYTLRALTIIGEYLDSTLLDKLSEFMGFTTKQVKAVPPPTVLNEIKNIDLNEKGHISQTAPVGKKREAEQSFAVKKLAKTNISGMSKIGSFFTKKA